MKERRQAWWLRHLRSFHCEWHYVQSYGNQGRQTTQDISVVITARLATSSGFQPLNMRQDHLHCVKWQFTRSTVGSHYPVVQLFCTPKLG